MTACEICTKDASKYTCPTCSIKYCSLDCWKSHKESPCEPKETTAETVVREPNPMYYPTDDTVPSDQLERLKSSSGLKALLANPHLRNLLLEVDSANDAWKAMSAAMTEPLFLEFTDEVLKIIEPDTEATPTHSNN